MTLQIAYIKKNLILIQGQPYNDCVQNAEDFELDKTIVKHILTAGNIYTQQQCFKLCFDLYYLNDKPCNCTNAVLGNVWLKVEKHQFIFKITFT